jgi:hypothetical protein
VVVQPRRIWLVGLAVTLFAVDVALTLSGQQAEYWAGDYGALIEGNPVAVPLLLRGPWAFLTAALLWCVAILFILGRWRHPIADWCAVLIAFGHALGGASWLIRHGVWGWLAAAAYIALAAEATAWCWRRSRTAENSGANGCKIAA